MSIYDELVEICKNPGPGKEALIRWRSLLDNTIGVIDTVATVTKQIRARPGFERFISVGELTNLGRGSPLEVSVRFRGLEVASIAIGEHGQRRFRLPNGHIKELYKKWGYDTNELLKAEWTSPIVRKLFAEIVNRADELTDSNPSEREIESRLIAALLKSDAFRRTQPVTLGRLPCQIPVPFVVADGHPKPSKKYGWIDVLGRSDSDGTKRIVVFELKKPGGTAEGAALQAYVYCSCLRMAVADTELQSAIWRLCNYTGVKRNNSRCPSSFKAVMVVAEKDKTRLLNSPATKSVFAEEAVQRGTVALAYVTYTIGTDRCPIFSAPTTFGQIIRSERTRVI